MTDQHPYRNNPEDSDRDEDPEEQVVFDISGKSSLAGHYPSNFDQGKVYYLSPGENSGAAPCGILCWRFPSLGRYATLNVFITVLTALCCFQGMFYAFWISIITSIEKQYELSSSQIGFVTSLGEIGRIVCLLGLSFYGELAHRPRWIAMSAFLVIVSYILLDIPDLLAPDSTLQDLTENEVCRTNLMQNETSSLSKCAKSDQRLAWRTAAMVVFSISHFLSGMASGMPIIYGIALIQDHFVRKDSSLYLGLHFLAKVLGPVFGFLLGALSTAMFVGRSSSLPQFADQDPRWLNVRAWHVTMGILVIGLLNFFAALAMLMFPSEFAAVEGDTNNTKMSMSQPKHVLAAVAAYRRPLSIRLLMPFVVVKEDVKKLIHNQIFMTRVAVVVINVFVLSGFYVFLPKYLETQFYVEPNAANIATAIAILLPTGCGILVGCFLYRYCEMKPKHSTLITMTTSIIFFVGFLVLVSFRCETRRMAGFPSSSGLIELETQCNSECNCQDNVFSPVCDVSNGINYFSACRAGCEQDPSNMTHMGAINCHCASATTLSRIPRGFCRISCNKFWPFIFMLFLILFICSIPTVGSVMLIYRTVPGDLMLMAHLSMAICVGVLALFPSPMVFGGIIDSSCMLWSSQGCSSRGACLLHDNTELAFRVSGTISGLKVLALLIEIYMFWKSRKLEFDEIEPAIMWSPDAVRMAFTETVGR